MFTFKIHSKDQKTKARVGELLTPHGSIKTPCFIPVGTQATVKTLSAQDLQEIGAQIVLANTYHLSLRPGAETIERLGGLAEFMGWGEQGVSPFDAGDVRESFVDGESNSHSLSESRLPSNDKINQSYESAFSSPAQRENSLRSKKQTNFNPAFSSPADRKTNLLKKSKPTMTDSGGYQVFSLGVARKKVEIKDRYGRKMSKFSQSVFLPPMESARLLPALTKTRQEREFQKLREAKITEDGVWFYSHVDGSKRWFDAEVSITIQEKLGADLIVAFDDHESPLWDFETTLISLERTNRWALQSIAVHKRSDQLMYGIVHGGQYEELRKKSAKFVDKYFKAIAIGGSYTAKHILYSVLDWTVPLFSEDKPRHLLGIGEVQDLFEAVSRGMDFFDCVAPTRRGRHGNLYISAQNGGSPKDNFTIQMTNAKFTLDSDPVDPGCECYTCQHFTRAYLHHLFMANELLAQRLGSYHNVYFIVNLVKRMREAILEGRFSKMKEKWLY